MRIAVTDIEANGLFNTVDKFHCAWIIDPLSGERKGYRPDQFSDYCDDLSNYDLAVLHNGIDYDFSAIKKLNPSFNPPPIFDTLVLSRMLEPDRIQGHSLDSWGKVLGINKMEYGKDNPEQWEVFDEEMFVYCERDVEVTERLYLHLCELAGFDPKDPPRSIFDYQMIEDMFK
ncbi:exonuclease [Proteus phage Privateer]|uniref:Exonuclease n=1 Tax=Proteus phage Privateer TaxID=2712958 RepID=A0A6G8R3T3_9CAUD|nr:DNA polymerase exonuclease subunit [Proteus phage Privateer]QIN94865.1 exonuclease [Proteus phage Privateer]